MQKHLVPTLGKVVEQTRLRETVGLKIVPRHITQVTLVKIDMQETDDGTRLVLLVSNFFFYFCDLEVIKDTIGKHEAHQRLVVE